MPLLGLLGCGLEPPLSFDELLIGDLTFETMEGDLAFQDAEESGTVESMDYALKVDDTQLYDDVYEGGSEVDGGLVLAPVALDYRDVFEASDLFHVDDEVPFTVTAHYVYDTAYMHLEYVLEENGSLPAPRAPRFSPTVLSTGNLAVDVVNDNVDELTIALQGTSVAVDGVDVGAGDPPEFTVPGDGGTVAIDLPLTPGSGWDGRAVTVRIRANAVVDTVFGPIPLTVDQSADLD